MSRLARALGGGSSGDILPRTAPIKPEEAKEYLDERVRKESRPVRTKLDLEFFKRFAAKDQSLRGRHTGKWFRIGKRGDITLTNALSREFEDGAKVGVYVNNKGSILVMKEEEDGIPLTRMYKTSPRSMMRRCSCKEIGRALEQAGVTLPARFMAEWDADLGAWVGRREG